MPEGHVIHRLQQDLDSAFLGTRPQVSSPQGRFAQEAALLDGAPYAGAHAHGKHLFIAFDLPSPERIVHVHLGLIGNFSLEAPEDVWGQIRLRIAGDEMAANLRGPQWCRLITEEEMTLAVDKLGPDPLLPDSPAAALRRVARSRRSIASLLMDQKYFAGVGNIYRAESLFRLGISPFAPGASLTPKQLDLLWDDLAELMASGVEAGRIDTVRPEHTPEAMDRPPRKDDHGGEVYVYRRAGDPCFVCGAPIAHQVLEGRNLFWCPKCQPGIG